MAATVVVCWDAVRWVFEKSEDCKKGEANCVRDATAVGVYCRTLRSVAVLLFYAVETELACSTPYQDCGGCAYRVSCCFPSLR